MFKVGDRVRVLRNRYGAFHPTEHRHIEPGEEVDVLRVRVEALGDGSISGEIFFRVSHGENFLPFEAIELVPRVCTCSVIDLVLGSCVCGTSSSGG